MKLTLSCETQHTVIKYWLFSHRPAL